MRIFYLKLMFGVRLTADCNVVIAGDFNADLDSADNVARSVTHFVERYSLLRCDNLSANNYYPTYVNLALNQQSRMDYILASPDCNVRDFTLIPTFLTTFLSSLTLNAVSRHETPRKRVTQVSLKNS